MKRTRERHRRALVVRIDAALEAAGEADDLRAFGGEAARRGLRRICDDEHDGGDEPGAAAMRLDVILER